VTTAIEQLWTDLERGDLDHLGVICDRYEDEGHALAEGLRWLWTNRRIPCTSGGHAGPHWHDRRRDMASAIPIQQGPYTTRTEYATLRDAYEAAARTLTLRQALSHGTGVRADETAS
jgi:hypothetical protein